MIGHEEIVNAQEVWLDPELQYIPSFREEIKFVDIVEIAAKSISLEIQRAKPHSPTTT